uniref:Solute carrier family 66 member 2 n=1 Tax=Eptatretus burgeri TaxID=7764 RepID=A0A8C4Q008_EPTBU
MDQTAAAAAAMDGGLHVMVWLVSRIATVAIVVGGVVPFLPQYTRIRRSQSAEGFSTHVCLVLLLANILRIIFWFGHEFEFPLLMQSVVMIFAMILMIHLCTTVHASSDIGTRRHHFSDLQLRYFWCWSRFVDYIQCICVFSLLATIIAFLLRSSPICIEAIGFLALFTEAMLGAPQLYHNYHKHSTDGMSVPMVLMWTSGDTFKTAYFLVRSAPMQFSVCGALQMCVDVAILVQVCYYGLSAHHSTPHNVVPSSRSSITEDSTKAL